jgi:putative SOS response-associated peptidase YedK
MCSHYNLKAKTKDIETQFNARYEAPEDDELEIIANGYSHLRMPVICNDTPHQIKRYHWGLIPSWTKDTTQARELANMCLNAKIETIEEKPSFRESAQHKRCIIPATSFYEWKWLDSKGKNKEKYEIKLQNNQIFAFAGLWSDWTNKNTGDTIYTFTIVTTQANELMAEIHNTKKRMPVVLQTNQIDKWLNATCDLEEYSDIAHSQILDAQIISENKQQHLF